MKKNDFWFDINFWDEGGTEKRLNAALNACYEAHVWTVKQLNAYWEKNHVLPKFADYRPLIAKKVKGSKWLHDTQRYSLDRAIEQTFPYVTSKIKVKRGGKIVLAEPMPEEQYNMLQIQSRKVWKKYLAEDRGITTVYGIIFPEGEWKKAIREQLENLDPMIIPYLWHSVTVLKLDTGWKMRFNFHSIHSKKGREAKKELKKDAENLLSREELQTV